MNKFTRVCRLFVVLLFQWFFFFYLFLNLIKFPWQSPFELKVKGLFHLYHISIQVLDVPSVTPIQVPAPVPAADPFPQDRLPQLDRSHSGVDSWTGETRELLNPLQSQEWCCELPAGVSAAWGELREEDKGNRYEKKKPQMDKGGRFLETLWSGQFYSFLFFNLFWAALC